MVQLAKCMLYKSVVLSLDLLYPSKSPGTVVYIYTLCTDELKEIVTAHIKPAQVQARQYPSTEKGKWT